MNSDANLDELIANIAEACEVPFDLVRAALQNNGNNIDDAVSELLTRKACASSKSDTRARTSGSFVSATRASAAAPVASRVSVSAASAHVKPAEPDEEDECAICFEELKRSDRAMRCDGKGGARHYGHAKCLEEWATKCRANGNTPSCPICRGSLQMHRRRLGRFVDDSTVAVSHPRPQVIPELLRQSAPSHRADEDTWEDISWGEIGTAVAIGAVAALGAGMLISALMKGNQNKRDRRR